jgi:hypothetical protein
VRPRRKVLPTREEKSRLEILLAAKDIETIRVVADLTGHSTATAVVRDALKAYAWLVTEQRRNRRVISEDRERGDRVELMPLLQVTAHTYAEAS